MDEILVVDDEQRMLDLLSLYLSPHGYICKTVASGEEALKQVEQKDFDLILLDIMMPDKSGWETCEEIREITDIPIIMVSARDQKPDIVKGLRLGADDYITKPFDETELLARMDALLRRFKLGDKVDFKGLIWDGVRHELKFNDKEIRLTPKEFSIIGHVMKHPNLVFSREQLIELIWGLNSETEGRTVDSHVRNIREKIRHAGFPVEDHLLTVWGVGYKWIK
ncbi:response regulator transcription factor [Salipaludibacillus sp. CF4.18]|uniref:response regulator transcription factor n=1 Tax=Salipaludibacillus sp. CF4.18 TaxID=3373081 RepID=UPI003EE5A5C3